VARPELGTKRICPVTGRKFYDLNKDPIVSPYTGQIVPIASASSTAALRSRTTASDTPSSGDEGEELIDPAAGDVELVSLEEADEGAETKKAPANDEDLDGEEADSDDDSEDDAFLEEEDDDGDVSDLIDSDIDGDEES
jgi:uncharacterized protein (TIGR02300 family)